MVTRPNSNQARLKRHARVRSKVSGTAACPRLDVFRSNSNIYAQLIDDVNGVIHLSRPCQGACRRCPRGRTQVLIRRNTFGYKY